MFTCWEVVFTKLINIFWLIVTHPLQAEEALHAQIAKSKSNLAPLQSSDLLDDAELLAEDRELDAELTGIIHLNN